RQHLAVKKHRGKLYQSMTDAMFGRFDWLVSGRADEALLNIRNENNVKAPHQHDHLQTNQNVQTLHQSWIVSGRADEALLNIRNENNVLIQKENRIQRMMHVRDGFLRFIAGIAIVLMMFWANMETGEGSISPTI